MDKISLTLRLELRVLKPEVLLHSGPPSIHVIKPNVAALLVLRGHEEGLFQSLEPRIVLLVEPPVLLFQRPGSRE